MALSEILLHPELTEKSMRALETENKLIFIVNRASTKPEIKKAVERIYQVKVASVTTAITPRGEKKATVRLAPDHSAEEVAARIGIF